MSLTVQTNRMKETALFQHEGNKIYTSDREIDILVKFEEPLIVVLGNVLSIEECDILIELSKDKLERSKIGTSKQVSDIRTSSGTFLDLHHETIDTVEQRIAEITQIPRPHGEGLHILNYEVDQQYKAHFDYFTKTSAAAKNNRIATVVLYLNDVENGGETYFPHLDLRVYPKKGMAVYFEYFYSDEVLNEKTLHAGMPVVQGEKWIATQWIRRQRI